MFRSVLLVFLITPALVAKPLKKSVEPAGVRPQMQAEVRPGIVAAEYHLPNGLTLILTENPKAPVTSIIHWVKAGSLQETPGITGIAHLFEHMMFRPLHKGAASFADIAQSLGADVNANTRFTSTVFETSVPQDNLDKMLKAESDRFKTLKVSDESLDLERKAVWSEYSTKMDSDPVLDLWETIYRVGFPGHPYGWTIIGVREDLDRIHATDCNKFFEKNYRPNNIGLLIAGNFKKEKVLEMVRKHYADWVPGEAARFPPLPQVVPEPVLKPGKLKAAAKNILFGYRIPEYTPKNVHLLNLVNHILFESELSLLRKRLLADKIVAEVSAFNFEYDSGMMKGFAVALPGVSVEQVLESAQKMVVDFEGLSEEKLDNYRRDFHIDLFEDLQRNQVINDKLAVSWGKYGGIQFLAEESRAPITVSRAAITDFLKTYIKPSNRVSVYSPQ